MRVLVEILHPAHVHFFRNAIKEWIARGDQVLVLSREKDVANELLRAYGIEFESISRLGGSKWSLVTEMVVRDVRMLKRARSFRPDVLVGIMGVTIVQVAKLLRKPAIVFYDTENAHITNRFVYPLAHSVCTPSCYLARIKGRHIRYPSYHELAYLHPNRFEARADRIQAAGVDPGSTFFLLRFVSWQASHDVGEHGFDLELKKEFIALLQEKGRVLISSEGPLPQELAHLRFQAPAKDIHHFVAFAALLVGESATMASEAAVLGTPAFYIADTGRGYTDELEDKYGLVYNYKLKDAPAALSQLSRLLKQSNLKEESRKKLAHLLKERCDATSWLLDYVDSVVSSN